MTVIIVNIYVCTFVYVYRRCGRTVVAVICFSSALISLFLGRCTAARPSVFPWTERCFASCRTARRAERSAGAHLVLRPWSWRQRLRQLQLGLRHELIGCSNIWISSGDLLVCWYFYGLYKRKYDLEYISSVGQKMSKGEFNQETRINCQHNCSVWQQWSWNL